MATLYKKHLENVLPYKAGVPIDELKRRLGREDVAKLNSNENLLGPSPQALQAIQDEARRLHLYPDPANVDLKAALKEVLDIPEDHIVVHHGGEAVIELFNQTFMRPGDEVLTVTPTFPFFNISTSIIDGDLRALEMEDFAYDIDALIAAITPKTRIIYLANPNNPTGTSFGREDLEKVLDAAGDDRIVLHDEAYYEYVRRDDYPDTMQYIREGKNLVIMRTFSKVFGLAGVRIGYAIARPELSRMIRRARMTFAGSRVAQVAAAAALRDREHIERSVRTVHEGLATVESALERMGLRYFRSDANFVLFDAGRPCQEVFEALLEEAVVVRPIFDTYVRVTIGRPEQNRQFIAALERVLTPVTTV